jgi:hypothetical protein
MELCALRRDPAPLLLKYFFNLADFLLDFAGELFVLALGFQVGVVRDLSGCLFDVAFQFMNLAFDLIFRARFHLVSPLSLSRTFHKTLFPVFGEVALLLSGIAQALECHVVAGRGLGQIASDRLSAPTRISPPSATEQKQY